VNTNALKTIAARAASIGLAAVFSSAQAHVVLEYQVAPAGSGYKATFKVGHGCGESPTRQLLVQIPAGVTGARPMRKPGWTVQAEPGRITWTANTREDALPSGFYDEFVLVATLPKQAGPLYWPVSQVCEQGRSDWTEVPAPGQKLHELKSPAAVLEILPADGAGGHNH
jgi:uncharacterized protein YcnI